MQLYEDINRAISTPGANYPVAAGYTLHIIASAT